MKPLNIMDLRFYNLSSMNLKKSDYFYKAEEVEALLDSLCYCNSFHPCQNTICKVCIAKQKLREE
jgi:hypothetical protein